MTAFPMPWPCRAGTTAIDASSRLPSPCDLTWPIPITSPSSSATTKFGQRRFMRGKRTSLMRRRILGWSASVAGRVVSGILAPVDYPGVRHTQSQTMQHAPKTFVHLHNHTEYSLLDGASRIPAMVARAAELEMPALGLTDNDMDGAKESVAAFRDIFSKDRFLLEVQRHGIDKQDRVNEALTGFGKEF